MTSAVAPFVGRRPQQRKERTHQGHSCGFRSPLAKKASGSRARRSHKGLQKQLHGLKDLSERLPVQGGDYAYASPSVGPDLKVWAVPQHGEAQLSRLGLSLPGNSQNRSRTGLQGITTHGKKQIRWSCRLMEEMKRRCAVWTVNLCDSDYRQLAETGNWPVFQRRIYDLLARYLKSYGNEAIAVGVCEIGPERYARDGLPCPHIHILTTGWGVHHPDGEWLLSPKRMDQLVAQARQYAGLPLGESLSASNIAAVRHSVGSYMSKYLTKAAPREGSWEGCTNEALIPHQWWNQTSACKAMVDGCFFRLPPAFAAFVIRCMVKLEALELGRGGLTTVGYKETKLASLPIEMYKFQFKNPECMHAAIELFVLWCNNEEELDISELVMSSSGVP